MMDYFTKKTLKALCAEALGCISKLADATNEAVQDVAESVDSIDKNALSANYDSENEMLIFTKKG